MKSWGWALAGFMALSGTVALAEPGLGNKVYSPFVKNGVTELELRGGSLTGGSLNGESGGVVELEHGFSDRFSLAVLGEIEHHAGGETKLDAVAVEGVAYLGQIPKLGIDVGGYLEYEQRIHNESGVVEAKLLLAKEAGPFEGLFNLIVDRPLTNKPGEDVAAFGYAAQATVKAGHGLKLGVQGFGDLGQEHHLGGRQAQYLGPVANWELHPWPGGGELELEAAYLLPLGAARDETDGQFRLVVELERRF